MFILGRDTPLEVIVPVEGWIKVRDCVGTIGWVERRAVSDRRSLVVRVAQAEVRAEADDAAPLVFRAERGVLLELAEPATGATTTARQAGSRSGTATVKPASCVSRRCSVSDRGRPPSP